MVGSEMSLRFVYKLVGLLLAVSVVIFAVSCSFSGGTSERQVNEEFRALAKLAEANRGDVLTADGQALEYTLPPSAKAVRLLTNANLQSIDAAREQRRANPALRWQYAIEVEELDAGGKVLQRRAHHFRRDLTEVKMPGGRKGTGAFYLERDMPVPLPAASLKLNFAEENRPARIRVRLVNADPGIADLLVRVSVPAPPSQRNADTMWHRLSEAQREKLASGNVYPPTLLTEQERATVLESRWQPLGPSSESAGRDIYVVASDDRGAAVESAPPAGLMAAPDRVAAVQLPEAGGTLRIVLEPEDNQADAKDTVNLRWSGHSAFERRDTRYEWKGGRFVMEERFGGGWLEIGATRPARVRVLLIEDGKETDITPPVQYLRAWLAHQEAPLDYSISHVGEKATPVRMVFRLASQGQQLAAAPVTVRLLAKDGSLVRQTELKPQFVRSDYDSSWPDVAGEFVSEPWEAFFNIPPSVAKMQIVSSDAVLVNAYSRPADLPRVSRMPEDVRAPESAKTAIPGWFLLNPDAYENRILDGDSGLLMVQSRPPEDRPELVAGRYQWEDFDPVKGGAARVFLAPREPGVPDRQDALAGTFRPVPRKAVAEFAAAPGRSTVTPRLAWVGGTSDTFDYKILLDGREWAKGVASGRSGELAMPAFEPGKHRLEIASEAGVRWYANHLEKGAPWVKRRAYRFDKPLQFDIERTSRDEEFVSVRLFRPSGVHARTKVRVKIDAPYQGDSIGPFPGWLFLERTVDVRPSGELALPVAETAGEKTDAGQPFFIPLPKGAPRGRYRITVTPEDGMGWIALSRVMPGADAVPTLVLEGLQDVE